MIETDQTGNQHIRQLIASAEIIEWSDWEHDFIASLHGQKYEYLSKNQKGVVSRLWEKLHG